MASSVDAFLLHLQLERGLSEHTIAGYSRDLVRLMAFVPEGRTADALTRHDVEGYIGWLRDERELSARSAARAFAWSANFCTSSSSTSPSAVINSIPSSTLRLDRIKTSGPCSW
ncbi:MAG: site-specific integrase, partial [Myxococcota bacterium]|nr:site-specific integrase [Myxococcota bacterium]